MALIKQNALGSHKRAQVQTADKARLSGHQFVAVAMDELGLHNGRSPFWTSQGGFEGKFQINVTVIPESDTFGSNTVTQQTKQGEITLGAHGLPTVGGQHHVSRVFAQAVKKEPGAINHQTIRRSTHRRFPDSRIVGVVHPIYPRC